MIGDATSLYNAGTEALEQGRLGEAVAFLLAARRLDPRAPDIRRNLDLAERAVVAARGESAAPAEGAMRWNAPISAAEGWWLAALLLAAGALLGSLSVRARLIGRARPLRRAASAAAIAGAALGCGLGWSAAEEHRRPEGVVIARDVETRAGVDEAPRPPILLRAGERVRIGRSRGGAAEIWLGGSAVGWVPAEAVWRVAETPGYTRRFGPG